MPNKDYIIYETTVTRVLPEISKKNNRESLS